MLPFFAAGGAISGSSFGLFYTILMQVGYNYYGKIALKKLGEGVPLHQILLEIQQEVQPFSDAMMQMALDKMPDVIESSMDAFTRVITSFGTERAKELSESWLFGLDRAQLASVSQLQFGQLRRKTSTESLSGEPKATPFIASIRKSSPLQEIARQKQLAYEMQLREKKKLSVELLKTKQPVPQIRQGVIGKKKAGQSQVIERLKLIREIQRLSSGLSKQSGSNVRNYSLALRRNQQLLVNLLARYRF